MAYLSSDREISFLMLNEMYDRYVMKKEEFILTDQDRIRMLEKQLRLLNHQKEDREDSVLRYKKTEEMESVLNALSEQVKGIKTEWDAFNGSLPMRVYRKIKKIFKK